VLLVRGTGGGACDLLRARPACSFVRVIPVRPDTLQSAWKQYHNRCNPSSVTLKVFLLPQAGQSDRYRPSGGKFSDSTYPVSQAGDFIVVFPCLSKTVTQGLTDMVNAVNQKNLLTTVDKPDTHKEQHPIGKPLL